VAGLLGALLATTPAGAQTVVYETRLDDFGLGPLVPTPVSLQRGTRRGALAFAFGGWALFVPNSPHSGLGGANHVPGVCIEWIWFTPPAPEGHRWDVVQLADGDGDGDTDLVVVSLTTPFPYRVINLDVVACQ
jgi:hypothetical protein